MPRNPKLSEAQIGFLRENAYRGGVWLGEQLGLPKEAIYQWATDNKISVKKREYNGQPIEELRAFKNRKRLASKWPKNWRNYKKLLVERDGLRCHYCDVVMTYESAQIDHVVPRVRGGSDAPHNLVLACYRCNHIKGSACYQCPEFRGMVNVCKE